MLHIASHPLIAHHLTRLRSTETAPAEFRRLVRRLTALLAVDATQQLQVRPVAVRTPLATAAGAELTERVGLVPILRAGLGMVEPLLDILPDSEVWHLGLYRDETTALPVEYYCKLPPGRPVDVALVLDPMLATGGSASLVLGALQRWGVRRLSLLSLIAAPEGVAAVRNQFADAHIFVCAVDSHLDERKFIVPGLGDAGDRTFHTTNPA